MDEDLAHFRRARLQHDFRTAFGDMAHTKAIRIMTVGTPVDLADALVDDHARERRAAGDGEDAIAEACALLRQAYASAPNLLPEELDGSVRMLADISVSVVMQMWLGVLGVVWRRTRSDSMFLMRLDDAMLPPMDAEHEKEFFRKCFVNSGFGAQELREGLRLIRRNLANGALLHPDAMALLGIVQPEIILA